MSPAEDKFNRLTIEPTPKPDYVLTTEDKFNHMIIRVIATTIISIVAIVGGCTAHSNSYDAERLSEEVKIVAENSKAAIASSKAKLAKVEAMERMVKDGANPVAIRCMVDGWKDIGTCMAVGLSLSKELPKE